MDEYDDRSVSLLGREIVDRLESVVSVGNVELAGEGFDGFGTEQVVSVEVLLKIRVAGSKIKLIVEGVE